jgi:hypothetical protein
MVNKNYQVICEIKYLFNSVFPGLLMIVFGSLFLTSCFQTDFATSINASSTLVIIDTVTLPPPSQNNSQVSTTSSPPSQTDTSSAGCGDNLELIVGEPVNYFYWSEDSKSLFYALEANPLEIWVYDIEKGTNSPTTYERPFTPTPDIIDYLKKFHIPEEKYNLFIAPSGQNAIYTLVANDSQPSQVPSLEGET